LLLKAARRYSVGLLRCTSRLIWKLPLTPLGAVLSAPVEVSILTEAPAFDLSVTPPPVTLNAGDALSLSLSLTAGSGPFTYQWRKDGAPVAGATSPTYAVASTKAGDSGLYSLTVTNALGSASSNNIFVTVVAPPPDNTPTVLAWGNNVNGQVGDGNDGEGVAPVHLLDVDEVARLVPDRVDSALEVPVLLAAGTACKHDRDPVAAISSSRGVLDERVAALRKLEAGS
jgi:hypothetical protein